MTLVFFEAKHFANKELRAEGTGEPAVVGQVRRYACMLRTNEDAIKHSYLRVCGNLTKLRNMAERYPKRHVMMRRAVETKDLFVDKKPRLIVFGFDEDQKTGRWVPQLRKIQSALGKKRVLVHGSSKDFRKGISTDY